MDACDWRGMEITPDHIRRAKQAYFANISYIDDKIGEILAVLEATRQDAHIVFLSDHGEMLGQKGLWFKMKFFEGSARVPLMISAPEMPAGLVESPVSSIDLAPTRSFTQSPSTVCDPNAFTFTLSRGGAPGLTNGNLIFGFAAAGFCALSHANKGIQTKSETQ